MKYIIEQPQPFDHLHPRYHPQRPFPLYRHIPGITPHPYHHPMGHSYGLQELPVVQPPSPDKWRENDMYLYGVDLYNFSYWWEAAEIWEGIWRTTEGHNRLFLQGLIHISAALLKWHMRKLQGMKKLSASGRYKLRQVLNDPDTLTGVYMGMDLTAFLNSLDTFFSPFISETTMNHAYSQQTANPLIYLHL